MDLRRLKLLSLGLWKALVLCYWLLCRRDWRNAWSFVYATLFTRDAGLALLDPIYRIFPRLASYPKQIEVETTTACQLKCQICEHSYWNEKPRHMSFEQFLQIMNMFPDLRWIGLTGIGSGFLNPDYRRMLRFLKQEKKVFVEFFDHFSHLEKSWMDEWIDLGIDKVWVSLENARAESYEKNRVGASFAKVMENLSYLVEAKRKRRSPLPELWFHFIINRYNEGEMEEYVNLVDRLTSPVKHLFPPIIFWTNLLAFDEVADLVVAIPEQRREGILQKCQERGIYAIWNENVSHDKSMTQCTKWTEPFILVSGHLQPCCALNEANQRRYQEEHAFINVFEEDFHQFWDGDRLKNFVRTLQSGGINEVCRYCHIFNHPGIWRGLRRKM